ncbi:hypothetical protein D3C81_2126050 [compost metagenome]
MVPCALDGVVAVDSAEPKSTSVAAAAVIVHALVMMILTLNVVVSAAKAGAARPARARLSTVVRKNRMGMLLGRRSLLNNTMLPGLLLRG